MPVMAPPLKATCQRRIQPIVGRLGCAYVGTHRDVHADVARDARKNRANGESTGRCPVEGQAEYDAEHNADDGDGRILSVEVSLRTRLNRCCDFLHAGVAGIETID